MTRDHDRLRDRLRRHPWLVADGTTGTVSLVDRAQAFKLMNDAGMFPSRVMMNAEQAFRNFASLAGKADRSFRLQDLTPIAAVPYHRLYEWMADGVVTPTVRGQQGSGRGKNVLFGWADAFCVGLVGSLRRNGVRLDTLRRVQPLFVETKKKRTGRKGELAARS